VYRHRRVSSMSTMFNRPITGPHCEKSADKLRACWNPAIYRSTKSPEKMSTDFRCHTTNFLSADKKVGRLADIGINSKIAIDVSG